MGNDGKIIGNWRKLHNEVLTVPASPTYLK
jgi:hypothetical protein